MNGPGAGAGAGGNKRGDPRGKSNSHHGQQRGNQRGHFRGRGGHFSGEQNTGAAPKNNETGPRQQGWRKADSPATPTPLVELLDFPAIGSSEAQVNRPGSSQHNHNANRGRGRGAFDNYGGGGGDRGRGRGGKLRNSVDSGPKGQHQSGKRNQVGDENVDDSDIEENLNEVVFVPMKKKRERKHEGPVFGFKRMYNFLDSPTESILLSINKDKDDWKELLESNELVGDKMIVAIHIIGEKICVDEPVLKQHQANALTACCSKSFVAKLDEVVTKITYGTSLSSRRNPNASTEYPVDFTPLKVLTNIYNLCNFVMETMPNNAVDFFKDVIVKCVAVFAVSSFPDDLRDKFKALFEQIKEMQSKALKKEETKNRQRCYGFNEDDMAEFDNESPPDHIKDIDIIPSIDELRSTAEPFLRPNKTTGAYNNCDHYLDVQFRLLREDFVQPLRNGIRTFMKERHEFITAKKKMPLGEIRLYPKVRIVKVEKEMDTVVYKLQLSEASYKRIKWEKSKRLLPASLIMLTTIDTPFQSGKTYFGTVFSRKVPELVKGIVSVAWEGSSPMYDEDEEYLMFESEVYLEAYRHTLDTLKKLRLDMFSMKKFIVEASNVVEAPTYLKDATSLLRLQMADGSEKYVSHDQTLWPTCEEFGLDDNQLEAFRAAVTKEFTIIQGPPGTGKTFLGLKVAETLLNNSNLWNKPQPNPITVVCYTNHALDQFLEGIMRYYEREQVQADIIRIGGRCKSEALLKFSLREVRRRNKRKLPHDQYLNERNAREEVYELEGVRASRMNEVTGLLDLQGIINFESLSCWTELQPEYPSVVWKNFQNLEWMGIGKQLSYVWRSGEDMTQEWFQVRQFPKSVPRKSRDEKKVERVERNTVNPGVEGAMDVDEEDDEEDYDLDELTENRIDLDEIFIEAQTSQRINLGRRLSYLPNCSIKDCENAYRRLNNDTRKAIQDMNSAQTQQYRQSKEAELMLYLNRQKLFEEIFRLFNGQLLDLPDVTDLLADIRAGKTVHYDKLKIDERWALYFAIADRARTLIAENVATVEKQLSLAQKELRNIIQHGDGLILRDCKVVGLTTTGAAKYNNLLRMMKSKIVIVEEAAEVFEAHIVTCITENCEQLILIGDHRQLRPSPTVYKLARNFHLDLSLFERMLNNNLHCHQLKVQHRMRCQISDLVRGTIYEELNDHDSVKNYPDVKGLTKNVFFISHDQKEKSESDSMSKSNVHEAGFLAGLVRYLILQGYDPERITVLTMYTGQMFLLKKEINQTWNCKGVRVTCVDNFQGEENDIILLSLVRSNSEGKIGFLGIDNRICVSLSRAKHGLYVIGNMDMMEEKSKTWKAIKQKLNDKDFVGNALELDCQIHRTRSFVRSDKDFQKFSPEGGCTEMCNTTLSCSHKCAMVCHAIDKYHQAYKCRKPCLKQCANQLHPCKGVCSQPCPRCNVMVERTLNCELKHKWVMPCYAKVENYKCEEPVKKTLPCGHEELMACHIRAQDYTCKVKVHKELPCKHSRTLECHVDPASVRCKVVVPKVLPCGHSQNEECWLLPESIKCNTMVSIKLEKCGHEVQVACSDQDKKIFCKNPCTTRLDCGHQCTKICHVDDDPDHRFFECRKDCSKECADKHKCKVKHPCWKRCPPCKELIQRSLPCGHKKVLECHVDVNEYECLDVCQRFLPDCGNIHTCPNLCYQPCGPCQTKVKKRAPCFHEQEVICGQPALKQNCEEPVRPRTLPQCGHRDTRVPCKHDGGTAEELVKYCTKPCEFKFTPAGGKGCDHNCQGSCSECFQGRIHKKCQAECGKQLVCGHRCEVPCSAVCPPCKKPCLMKCEHTECKKNCGDPCSECKEKCTWKCPHKACYKLCGEICDREPCDEPCPKKLKCEHDCVGFCGEPCPPLCRVCDKDELTEIFFGNEDEENARFVYLADCKHTIEAEALENYLNNYGSGVIKAKDCPKCKTPIRNCRRFNNIIRGFYKDVMKVKMRSYGNQANSNKMRDDWITKLGDPSMERAWVTFGQIHARISAHLFDEVTDRKGKQKRIKKILDEFSMRSLDFIAKSAVKPVEELASLKEIQKLTGEQHGKVAGVFRKIFSSMLDRHPLSRQEVMDFNSELDRLDYFKQLMIRRCLPACNKENHRAYPTYVAAKKYVVSSLPLTEVRKQEFLRHLRELDDLLRSGLGITDRERVKILEAMGMGQGHWFKCPNGHIYVIGDCGGAMVQSRCNECGATIGGANHRLVQGNALASEMDGAPAPAWPTAMDG